MEPGLISYDHAAAIIGALTTAVISLAGAIVYLYKQNSKLQEERLKDLKEFRDKLLGPIENVSTLSQQMYNLLVDGNGQRRS